MINSKRWGELCVSSSQQTLSNSLGDEHGMHSLPVFMGLPMTEESREAPTNRMMTNLTRPHSSRRIPIRPGILTT